MYLNRCISFLFSKESLSYWVLWFINYSAVVNRSIAVLWPYLRLDVDMFSVYYRNFCFQVIPPPMSSHCRLCEKCYERVDHHCLYLYRCIAANNHRIFVFFNAVVLVSMILFEYACFLYVTTIY